MADARTERIDAAVSAGGELVGFLHDLGPLNSAQAKLIIEAAVRAAVPNAKPFEIRDSVKRVSADLEKTTQAQAGGG